MPASTLAIYPPVAQLDNAADSDSEERGFKSLRAGQAKQSPKQEIDLLFFGARDLKDERHRATVRWTVVTASDQAAAAARIKSLRAGQTKQSKDCFLYLYCSFLYVVIL